MQHEHKHTHTIVHAKEKAHSIVAHAREKAQSAKLAGSLAKEQAEEELKQRSELQRLEEQAKNKVNSALDEINKKSKDIEHLKSVESSLVKGGVAAADPAGAKIPMEAMAGDLKDMKKMFETFMISKQLTPEKKE